MTNTSIIQLSEYELSAIAGGDATSVAGVGAGAALATIGANAMVGAAAIVSAPFIGGFFVLAAGVAVCYWALERP